MSKSYSPRTAVISVSPTTNLKNPKVDSYQSTPTISLTMVHPTILTRDFMGEVQATYKVRGYIVKYKSLLTLQQGSM